MQKVLSSDQWSELNSKRGLHHRLKGEIVEDGVRNCKGGRDLWDEPPPKSYHGYRAWLAGVRDEVHELEQYGTGEYQMKSSSGSDGGGVRTKKKRKKRKKKVKKVESDVGNEDDNHIVEEKQMVEEIVVDKKVNDEYVFQINLGNIGQVLDEINEENVDFGAWINQ